MSPDWIIGALALVTIGGVLALSVFHFGFYLKDPQNQAAARRYAEDRESAATAVSTESAGRRSLRERLDDAPGINDRLGNRPLGLNPLVVLFETKWSVFRASLRD